MRLPWLATAGVDHRPAHRGRGTVERADRGLPEGRLAVDVADRATGHGQRDLELLAVHAERLGHRAHLVLAEVHAELCEGGVARDGERVDQRLVRAAVAALTTEVPDGRLRARQ